MVNDANMIQNDIFASNGYIHVIDKILIPEDLQDLKWAPWDTTSTNW